MKYFLPDSQDLVDPSFDYERETRSPDRVRQRDDLYAHEVLKKRAFDGILISRSMIESGGGFARYTQAQRRRLSREGARQFFRTGGHRWGQISIMGDCGAFSYVKEETPPFSVEEILDYYDELEVDFGISPDHIILAHSPKWDTRLFGKDGVPKAIRERQELTLALAAEFRQRHRARKSKFKPIGVAQGWSPASYAHSVKQLQKIGYRYVAVGGIVPVKTPDILAILDAVDSVRHKNTTLHLLGVTRIEQLSQFAAYGVVSFDSTSPLRQAFKDSRKNYYTPTGALSAIRIPQVSENRRLIERIQSGKVTEDHARKAERKALTVLREYAAGKRALRSTLSAVMDYEEIHNPTSNRRELYEETLEAKPWVSCNCDVCRDIGHHVVIFRGAERNRRRSFHNVHVFYQRLQREIKRKPGKPKASKGKPHEQLTF